MQISNEFYTLEKKYIMKKIWILMGASLVIASLISSCRKDPIDNLSEEETRIYVTNYDKDVDFGTYSTFSIVDSVAVVTNKGDYSKELTNYDQQLINTVKQSFIDRGYKLVDKTASPDLAVNLTRIDNTYSSVVIGGPGYWSGWPGYWDPGYWGYPGWGYYFPPYYGVFNYKERSVAIDLVDLKNAAKEGDNQLTTIWNAMLRGQGVWNSNNIESMVKAVFDQSTYLETTL